MLSISKERLKELISAAYENGWGGCLELKSEYVDQIMGEFERSEDALASSTLTIAAGPTYSVSSTGFGLTESNASFIPGYYSSFGQTQTSPIGSAWVNNPGEDVL